MSDNSSFCMIPRNNIKSNEYRLFPCKSNKFFFRANRTRQDFDGILVELNQKSKGTLLNIAYSRHPDLAFLTKPDVRFARE